MKASEARKLTAKIKNLKIALTPWHGRDIMDACNRGESMTVWNEDQMSPHLIPFLKNMGYDVDIYLGTMTNSVRMPKINVKYVISWGVKVPNFVILAGKKRKK